MRRVLPHLTLPRLIQHPLLMLSLFMASTAGAQTVVVFEVDVPPSVAADGRAWTEALRQLAWTRAPTSIRVLSPGDVDALLPPGADGKRLSLAECEGDCALQTGRTLGVDLMLTARLRRDAQGWQATVALTRTEDGRLLGQSVMRDVEARSALMRAATATMQTWTEVAPRSVVKAKPVYSIDVPELRVMSNVPTQVTIDGQPRGETPARAPVRSRYVRIEAWADGYVTQRLTVDMGPMSAELKLKMTANSGQVDLAWPPGYREPKLWVDGQLRRLTRRMRLAPGLHHVQLRTPCGDSPRVPVVVELDGMHSVDLMPKARCPRLLLRSKRPMKVRVDGTDYQSPATTHRVQPGRTRIERINRVQPWQITDVPEVGEDVIVDLGNSPLDFGAELGWQHRSNAGGLAYLRFWNHARQAMRVRWGMHLGIGVVLDDAPPDVPDRSLGGIFLGARWGIPIASWLEWTFGMEAALIASEDGAPLFGGADTDLRFRLPHFAVGVGWGVAAHGLVDDLSDAHGLRLSFALTE